MHNFIPSRNIFLKLIDKIYTSQQIMLTSIELSCNISFCSLGGGVECLTCIPFLTFIITFQHLANIDTWMTKSAPRASVCWGCVSIVCMLGLPGGWT